LLKPSRYSFAIRPHCGPSSTTVTSGSTDATVPTGRWTHVAAVIDSDGGTIYVDGEPETTLEGFSGEFDAIDGGELALGAFGLSGSEYFNGRIDEVTLYDRALSDAEVAALGRVGE
jgi:hypothetical protein